MNSQWDEVKFSEIVFYQEGPGLRSYQFKNTGIKVVNVTNIVNGVLDLSNTARYLDWSEFKSKYSHFAVEENDILMASSGATYGKTAIAKKIHLPLMMNTSVIRLHPKSEKSLNRNFLHYFLQTQFFKNQIHRLVTGSAQPNFGPTHLNRTKIIKPKSVLHQALIASKLDELFTKLDAGIECLKTTQILLKQYRQSVLKYAFEGKLTEKWRASNPKKIQLFSNFKKNEHKIKKKIRIDYKSINNFIGKFPPQWEKMIVYDISIKINPGFPSGIHNKDGKGIPHIRPMNINSNGEIDLSILKYVKEENCDRLRNGDVLFNNTNSPPLLGKTTYIKNDTNWAYSNHMTRIRPDNTFITSGYLSYYLHTLFQFGFFRINCSHHVNQASINSTFLSNILVPVPSIEEQNIIVNAIERNYSYIYNLEKIIHNSSKNIEVLRSSILKSAFEGRLVDQDPTDEPVSVLLKKIKQQKTVVANKIFSKETSKNKSDPKQMRLV